MNLQITVVFSPVPRDVQEVSLQLACDATVLQALHASGLLQRFPLIDLPTMVIGVWGRKVGLSHVLRDNDRVEIYRQLTVDPKVARRERFAKQGARTTGLFKTKRKDSAAGY